MRRIAEDVWVEERPLRFGALELGARMTVIRLADGSLFLHSPVRLDDVLWQELGALGAPRFAVSPNRFHHLFAGDYAAAFPGLVLYGAPGLAAKRPDLRFAGELGDEAPEAWRGQVDQAVVRGIPLVNEVAFLHRASRTLVLCDLAFHVGPEAPSATRLAFRLMGAYGRFGPTFLERLLVRDRAAARDGMRRILSWDFDRVIVSHGAVLETGGRAALEQGYRWLLGT